MNDLKTIPETLGAIESSNQVFTTSEDESSYGKTVEISKADAKELFLSIPEDMTDRDLDQGNRFGYVDGENNVFLD